MEVLDKKTLKKLKKARKQINLTAYLPIKAGLANTKSNVSSLHHMISVIKNHFEEAELPNSSKSQLNEAANKLEKAITRPAENKTFAVMMGPEYGMTIYEVPFHIDGTIYVMAHEMQLGPIEANFNNRFKYWVVSISQNGCKLYQGNVAELKPVNDKEISKDMFTSLRLDISPDNNVEQTHSVNSPGNSAHQESFNGQGGIKDSRKNYMEKYFRTIDRQIAKYIKRPTEPVILIGVDYVQNIFKKVSSHKKVIASRQALTKDEPEITNIKKIVLPLLPQLDTVK